MLSAKQTIKVFLCSLSAMAFITIHAQTRKGIVAGQLYDKAVLEIKSNHTQPAIQLLTELLTVDKDNVDAKVLLSKLYLNTSKYQQSLNLALQVLQQNPRYEDVYYYAIGDYLNLGNKVLALYYTDQALKYFPDRKEFLTKKIGILDDLYRYADADALAKYIIRKFPDDESVLRVCASHYQSEADWYLRVQKNTELAKRNYEQSLKLYPDNTDVKESLDKLTLAGNKDLALAQVNAALVNDSTSYSLLMKKLGLLQEMKRYGEALDVLSIILKHYPSDKKALALNSSLRMEAAAFFKNTNTVELYRNILDHDPSNKEVLGKVISASAGSGNGADALYYIDLALRKTPNDYDLLNRKMGVLVDERNYIEAANIGKRIYNRSTLVKNKEYILEIVNSCARYYLAQLQADSALVQFNFVLQAQPGNLDALTGRVNAYAMLNDRAMLLAVIDSALNYYPAREDLLMKKAGFLTDFGRAEEAAGITDMLIAKYPDDFKINSLYVNQRLQSAISRIKEEDYGKGLAFLYDVLQKDSSNKDALNYAVNVLDLTGRYDEALAMANKALLYYSEDKDLLIKKMSVLYNAGQFYASAAIAEDLHSKFPYNVKIKEALIDGLERAGKMYDRQENTDSALACYQKILSIMPHDSLAQVAAANIYISRKQYPEAMALVDSVLLQNPENIAFQIKRMAIFESLGDYKLAAKQARVVAKLSIDNKFEKYAAYLESKLYINKLSLDFLHTAYDGGDGTPKPYNVGTLSYSHPYKKGTYGGAFIYAGRLQGSGVGAEGQLSYRHSKAVYSDAAIGLSTGVMLPRVKVAYSVFKTFKSGYEVELGGRYLSFDSLSTFSLLTSVGRNFNKFWLNARVYGIVQVQKVYGAFNVTARYNLNDEDYINLLAGLGTSPDDRSRLVLFPNLVGVLSRSAGLGYHKAINYATVLGFTGVWTSQKISPAVFVNQYDFYLNLAIKF